MNNAQANINTSDHKPSTEELIQQTATIRQPTPVRPVSQPAPVVHHTVAPTGRQTRSHGPTEITSLFNHPSPPDAIQRKLATMANPVNTFTPITNNPPSQEDIEVASITSSTRLYEHSTGTGSGLPSGLGIQSENSAKEKGQTKSMGKPPMCLRCGRNSHTKYYCKDCKVSCRHCKSQTHASHCCAFIPRATSTSNGETSDTASTDG